AWADLDGEGDGHRRLAGDQRRGRLRRCPLPTGPTDGRLARLLWVARVRRRYWEGNAYWAHVGYPYDLSPNGDEPCYQLDITIDDDDDDDFDTVELETDADIASG